MTPKKPRRARRASGRLHEKLVRNLDRLARLAPGGSPQRALVIDSPAVVEVRAVAKPCPLCGGAFRLEEHAAVEIDGVRLRVARIACTTCAIRRAIYFRLGEATVH